MSLTRIPASDAAARAVRTPPASGGRDASSMAALRFNGPAPFGGWAVSERPLALRTRLATGVPLSGAWGTSPARVVGRDASGRQRPGRTDDGGVRIATSPGLAGALAGEDHQQDVAAHRP